jgi:branched-chain amino acid transport system substrate-binding protein
MPISFFYRLSAQTLRSLFVVLGLVLFMGTTRAEAPAPVRLAMIEAFSGPFANAGDAVFRNLIWAVERVNERGGVSLPGGSRKLELVRFDSKGNVDDAVSMLRGALDAGIGFVTQGNSSATAAALIDTLEKHNARDPARRAIFLNYSAVDPSLTNEKCSFWHFRFDAHADMRLSALTDVLRDDPKIKKVYLIGQNYSFGQHVVRKSREMLAAKRPDVEIVGEELHPMGRVKDFLPYASKVGASGAQAVITGNWGNDLTLLVKAVKDLGLKVKFYTFYGNGLGVPAALGDAGVDSVVAVSEWHPNLEDAASGRFYADYRRRFPDPAHDYVHARTQVMIEMLAAAMELAASTEPTAVARALEGLQFNGAALAGLHSGVMRAADHQFQQPLVVSIMERAGGDGVRYDVEGSGYGFRTLRSVAAEQAEAPHTCRMARPR